MGNKPNKSNHKYSKKEKKASTEKVIVGIDFGTSGIAYAENNKQKVKEIKDSFMPKIERKPKHNKFKNKLSSNLTKNIFNYLSYKEAYEMGKIDLFFMNNIIDYFEETEPWPEKVRKLKSKYKFIICQNEVDLTFKEAQMKKRKYKYFSENNKEINYYQYDIDGNKYISIATTTDRYIQNTYWKKDKIEGSYENPAQVPHLLLGFWISIGFSFSHIKPNYYKLYINEKFEETEIIKKDYF